MAVTTYVDHQPHGIWTKVRAAFSSILASMIAAREAQAQLQVTTALRLVDDQTLTRIGVTRKEVNLRPGAPFVY